MARQARRLRRRITIPEAVLAALVTAVASIVGVVLTRTIPERRPAPEAVRIPTPVKGDAGEIVTNENTVGNLHTSSSEASADTTQVRAAMLRRAGVILVAEAAYRKGTEELLDTVKMVNLAVQHGITQVPVGEAWAKDQFLNGPTPALVIIHSSAFQYVAAPKKHEQALFNFITDVSARYPSTRFLVYNAGFCDAAVAARWKSRFRKWLTMSAPQALQVDKNVDTFGFGCPGDSSNGSREFIQASVSRMLE